jgi:hypothetical protein
MGLSFCFNCKDCGDLSMPVYELFFVSEGYRHVLCRVGYPQMNG